MTARLPKLITLAVVLLASALSASCGEFTRESQSPSLIIVRRLEAAPGNRPDDLGGTLNSDVLTLVTSPAPCTDTSPCPTVFNDIAEVEMSVINRDPGVPGIASNPSFLGAVTISRYRVTYVRTDGRNTPGVDVPYPFDAGVTFTIPNDGVVTAGFQIVRHTAKEEAPLKALASNGNIISTIAEVTFYGRDQGGNEISASGKVGIDFGNFGDSN